MSGSAADMGTSSKALETESSLVMLKMNSSPVGLDNKYKSIESFRRYAWIEGLYVVSRLFLNVIIYVVAMLRLPEFSGFEGKVFPGQPPPSWAKEDGPAQKFPLRMEADWIQKKSWTTSTKASKNTLGEKCWVSGLI